MNRRDRLVRKALQAYWRVKRPATIGAQAMVLDASDRVLLVRHTYRPGWHFPGGGVERGESVHTALRRELGEEVGVAFAPGAEQLLGVYTNFDFFPGDHVVFFVLREWTQPAPPAPNSEIAEHGFFPCDALPQTTQRAAHDRIREVLFGAPRSQTW